MEFKQLEEYGPAGTGYHSVDIKATYAEVFAAFGEPLPGDDYKVSGEWAFIDDNGGSYTIYDWKSTNLYEPENPTIPAFRASTTIHNFYIGAFNQRSAEVFAQWVFLKLEAVKAA